MLRLALPEPAVVQLDPSYLALLAAGLALLAAGLARGLVRQLAVLRLALPEPAVVQLDPSASACRWASSSAWSLTCSRA